jgi:hypothetical protein
LMLKLEQIGRFSVFSWSFWTRWFSLLKLWNLLCQVLRGTVYKVKTGL